MNEISATAFRRPDVAAAPTAGGALAAHARAVAVEIAAAADPVALDADDAFPVDGIRRLFAAGLMAIPLRETCRGSAATLAAVLRAVGWASLPLGRLYEGHVNALSLVRRYGRPDQLAAATADVAHDRLFGVWNTEPSPGLRLVRDTGGSLRLEGTKTFASGAGRVTRPLVTASLPNGERLMLVARLDAGTRADISGWQAHGMRASASGIVDFTGLSVEPEDIIGAPGDYLREPAFSGGAWRFAAVQQGGVERVFDILRTHLRDSGRDGDPHQQARVGAAAVATETARLWVEHAADLVEDPAAEGAAAIAYVGLARTAVERAALDVIELAQRSIGLAGQMRAHPLERAVRDLSTYLRQPAPDRALTAAAAHVLYRDDPAFALWGR